MSMTFAPAKRSKANLKLAITGISGSGKTSGALRVARGLVGPNGRIAVIDTEHRSASLYEDITPFEVINLDPPYDAPTFAAAIEAAEKAGFNVLVIDTLSHAWEAVLDFKDALDRRGGSSFTNWNAAGEKWREVIGGLLNSKLHVIACLRSKTEYVLEQNEKGKSVPKKVGLAPIARDGTEYEFTVVFDLDMGHRAMASKDRTRMFDGKPTELKEPVGEQLAKWLSGGGGEEVPPVAAPVAPTGVKPAKSALESVTNEIAEWFTANDAEVNAYLRRVKWIGETETWLNLSSEKITTIYHRSAQFARAAGIPQMGGAK